MRSIYRRLSGVLLTALEVDPSASADAAIALHYETLEAIMSGRPDLTDEVMDRHLAYLEDRCEVVYGRARIPALPHFLLGSQDSANR